MNHHRHSNRTGNLSTAQKSQKKVRFGDFLPLVAVLSLVVVTTGALQIWRRQWNMHEVMYDFMACFFIIFSAFKLYNWSSFAEAYSTYDIVAKRSRTYAHAYPLVELALGIAYLFRLFPIATNSVTLGLMIIGSIGVAQQLLKRQQIVCACLGAVFRIPMTYVTLLEDVVMAIMAAYMLLIALRS